MLLRRVAPTTRPIASTLRTQLPRSSFPLQRRSYASNPEIDDPGMNGGYVNPPRIKRQHRDPYGDWWDKQERRNYGEPVHEDNDTLGVFSTEEYTHFTSRKAFFLLGCFGAAFSTLLGAVYLTYPDHPTTPRTFEGGLEEELGGSKAVRALKHGEA